MPILLLLALPACDGCLRQVPVEAIEELPYPDCGSGRLPEGVLLAEGHLRSGPTSRDPSVVERFEIRRRDCLIFATARVEWPGGTTDVEVIYDEDMRPLRAWKRTLLPSDPDPLEKADIRRYDLRTNPPTLKARTRDGEFLLRELRGNRPTAVVGPGRGLLTAWIGEESGLAQGEQSIETVLDFRSLGLERLDEVTLRRDPDREVPTLGGPVRVYSVFGRESVFTNNEGVVIGDLAGLRTDESLNIPAPQPIPLFGEPDPVNTP